jgi:uncharacterized protein YndB with AHSA1/START domain
VAQPRAEAAVEAEVRIAASRETVFAFFTDRDRMIQWIGRDAELDPRPGGAFRCDINGRDVAVGAYVEVDRPQRVVFTWGWESAEDLTPAPGVSTVEITLEEIAEGTLVRLVHRDLPTPEARAAHSRGWDHYLRRLAIAAADRDPGPDPWATLESTQPAHPEGSDDSR